MSSRWLSSRGGKLAPIAHLEALLLQLAAYMGKTVRYLLLGAVVCGASVTGIAQTQLPADPCSAMPAGNAAKGFFPFDQFDREMRSALMRQDATAMALLVRFPLRVNDAGGTISIDDATALQSHFNEVFTPAVRKEILNSPTDGSCNAEGIGYGRGVIWVNASGKRYAIESVNRDAVPPYPATSKHAPKLEYVCQTQGHRIVIDTVEGGDLRYRAWKKPRSVTEAPDLSLWSGKQRFDGSDVCAVPIYSFKNGDITYEVGAGTGCYSEASKPPDGATGDLTILRKDQTISHEWCF
jgi:hypothetical protein